MLPRSVGKPSRQPVKVRLTKTAVDAIKPPATGEALVWDDTLKGFHVRVFPSGKRTYYVYGRVGGSCRQVKAKLGGHGQITTEQARRLAENEIGKLMIGRDVSAEREQKRKAEKARLVAPPVWDLADEYLAAHAATKKRPISARDDRAMLNHVIGPRFGSRRVAEITHKDVQALHHSMRETPFRANRVIALISKLFNLALKWGD